ncbi:MAG TPA: potassium-transporting ATPase subunit C [Solirubrobacteraceae bacterium]|nr:potassium-transporting ATPase subunit C [Solirubrobacteraceae bacterium]
MRKDIRAAVTSMLALTLLLGILYPLTLTGLAQGVFPGNANGQLVYHQGRLVGSREIGQQFTDVVHTGNDAMKLDDGVPVTAPDKRYFQTRPSGTVPADNAAATTFANYGPNDKATEQAITANASAYLSLNRPYDPSLTLSRVPVDAVDTSASGIDPDISPANAAIQAHRVAAVRHLPLGAVMALVRRFTGGRGLGFSGEPSVNVLELNLALDRLAATAATR